MILIKQTNFFRSKYKNTKSNIKRIEISYKKKRNIDGRTIMSKNRLINLVSPTSRLTFKTGRYSQIIKNKGEKLHIL